jgi:hypothetical protein
MDVEQDRTGWDVWNRKTKKHTCPAHVYPPFCTTDSAARYFTFTLAGVAPPPPAASVAAAMRITACTVFAPEGSST